jgi:hypothetical protein
MSPGDSAYAVTGGEQFLIAKSIPLEGRGGFVGFTAVSFDDKSLIEPEEVGNQDLAVDSEGRINRWTWQSLGEQAGEGASLEDAAHIGHRVVLRAPVNENRIQGTNSAASARVGDREVARMQIKSLSYCGLLNQPAQRRRAEPTGLVDERPRWRRASDAFVLGDLLGLGVAAATAANPVDLAPSLDWNRDIDQHRFSIRESPKGSCSAVGDHGAGAAGKLGGP